MEPPRIPSQVDTLVIESTYGNRMHEPVIQAEGTLGRRLAEHAPKVKIFGVDTPGHARGVSTDSP